METKQLISANYKIRQTLLIRFMDDSIDETSELSSILAASPLGPLDFQVMTLSGYDAHSSFN